MKIFYLLFLCFAILLISAPNQSFAKSKTKKIKLKTAGKIYVPKQVLDFKLVETTKYPQKDFGVSFKFSNKDLPQARIDYYIYPMYKTVSIENIMYVEYRNVLNGIKTLAERDDGLFAVLNSKVIKFNNIHAIKTTMHTEYDKGIFISELYLSSINNHYIKFRATYPMYKSKELGMRLLVESLFKKLIVDTKFKSKKKTNFSINIQSDKFSDGNKIDMIAAIAYSFAVQSKIQSNLVDNFETVKKIYKETIEIVTEFAKKNNISLINDDDIINLYEVSKAGFLDEIIWEAYNRPYWIKPSDLRLNDFKQWAEKNTSKQFVVRPIGVNILINKYK